MVDNKMRPDTTSLAYNAMKTGWPLIRDLMGGTAAMQRAGKKWLPQWDNEPDTRYDQRLKNTILYNGFQRTVDVLAGKVFANEIVLPDDLPEQIGAVLENVDATGTNLDVFLKEWFSDGLQVGISHVLIDAPSMSADTVAEANAAGVLPYWAVVHAENLIFWESEQVGRNVVLSKIRIKRTVIEPDGWGERLVEEIQEYRMEETDQGRRMGWIIYRKNKDHEWYMQYSGITDFEEIPLVTFYARKTGFMTAKPPLRDLAEVNRAHWVSTSEQTHCLSIGRRPFPAFLGFQKEDVKSVNIGPYSGVSSSNPQAKVQIIESAGTALATGRQDLLDKKEEMAILGLELLTRKPVQKTATESISEKDQTESDLVGMVRDFESAVDDAIRITGDILGLDYQNGHVELNKQFSEITASKDELMALMQSRQARDISWVTFLSELKSRGVIPADVDPKMERAALAAEGM